MDRRAVYGPRDGTVLSQQLQHRSDDIPEGDIDVVLQAKRADGVFWNYFKDHDMHVRVLDVLHQIGFYGVYRCGRLVYDCHLITALVERWRPETHTFHFRVGEATITLEDVQIIWALPIDGLPVTGLDIERSTEEWQIYCREYLGFSPDEEAFKGSRLHTHAIMNFIRTVEITHDTPRPTVVQYTRCIAMLLLGGLMCPDSSGNMVPLLYLSKLEEINTARNYSWGSAVLAFYTGNYVMPVSKAKRQLWCIATATGNNNIWAWSRIIPLSPGLGVERLYMDQVQVNIDRFLPAAPYGAIWNCRHNFTRTVRTTVRVIRDILDNMQEDQFIWQPYDMDSDRIMAYAADFTPELWRSTCPLIFYAIVEIHHPERVLRQFGMRQNIPEMPDSRDMTLHQISRKARTGTDWGVQHILHIRRWQRRRDTIVNRPPISNERHTERGYWEWYNNITRRFVSSSTSRRVESGYQPGDGCMRDIVAEQIQALRLSNQPRPTDVEGLSRLLDRYDATLDNICQFVMHSNQNPTNENDPSTSHRQRRSNSRMSTTSAERDNIGVDIAGPSTAYTPQDYYVPQPSQQDDWFQSAPYMPSHAESYSAHVDLDLGLGVNQPYAPEYNVSPIPFPSFSAYRDQVESSSATTSSRLHINDDDDDNEQDEPTQNIVEEIRRPRRQRHRRNCGTGGHF
ncbi:UNVERIFIED_CONTAM: Serine/threonine-protein phosphatase 7 long form [Sesamum radiatum]|uniref:Serine/threonine-protein phosphatase 7 long form n=2 Tax=Sesamum radiatum TaxID=300843 RepID=A0AAW2NSC2_SESRA